MNRLYFRATALLAVCAVIAALASRVLAPLLPDPGQIAFSRYQAVDDDIWLIDLRTRVTVDVTHAQTSREIAPVWSPDGSRLAYVVSGLANQTRVVTQDFANGIHDEHVYRVLGGQLRPRWTNDGELIMAAEDRLFWRHSPQIGERVLAVLRAGGLAEDGASVGRAFSATSPTPDLRDVARSSAVIHDLAREIVSLWSPAWSLDERYLAVQTFIGKQIDLVVIDSACFDGACPRVAWRLTDTPAPDVEPAWSPDNAYVAFSCNDGENQEICIVGADGVGLQQITQTPPGVINRMPAWRPGG
ncbi:MAG: PD40 domain-containing protein [Anaerolineae bacterium]|nr:PD40 domain-containing protein [Anaerolineae bacterium]